MRHCGFFISYVLFFPVFLNPNYCNTVFKIQMFFFTFLSIRDQIPGIQVVPLSTLFSVQFVGILSILVAHKYGKKNIDNCRFCFFYFQFYIIHTK